MSFSCDCELEITGGAEADRRAAARVVLAADCVEEGPAPREKPSALVFRFRSVDGLPEDELKSAAPQFPGLHFTLAYFSKDGEFYGYARMGAAGGEAESEDFDDSTLETLTSEYDGDGIDFVKAVYGLEA
jgi:hypothetical protein